MKKIKYIALLIFLTGCTQVDYQKIDKIFGFSKVNSVDTLETYQIGDTSSVINPFKIRVFDSLKTAKKADSIKIRILSPKPKKPVNHEGWRKDPVLNSTYEEAKAFENARRQLREIYAENAKKAKEIKKSTAKDSTE